MHSFEYTVPIITAKRKCQYLGKFFELYEKELQKDKINKLGLVLTNKEFLENYSNSIRIINEGFEMIKAATGTYMKKIHMIPDLLYPTTEQILNGDITVGSHVRFDFKSEPGVVTDLRIRGELGRIFISVKFSKCSSFENISRFVECDYREQRYSEVIDKYVRILQKFFRELLYRPGSIKVCETAEQWNKFK